MHASITSLGSVCFRRRTLYRCTSTCIHPIGFLYADCGSPEDKRLVKCSAASTETLALAVVYQEFILTKCLIVIISSAKFSLSIVLKRSYLPLYLAIWTAMTYEWHLQHQYRAEPSAASSWKVPLLPGVSWLELLLMESRRHKRIPCASTCE